MRLGQPSNYGTIMAKMGDIEAKNGDTIPIGAMIACIAIPEDQYCIVFQWNKNGIKLDDSKDTISQFKQEKDSYYTVSFAN